MKSLSDKLRNFRSKLRNNRIKMIYLEENLKETDRMIGEIDQYIKEEYPKTYYSINMIGLTIIGTGVLYALK